MCKHNKINCRGRQTQPDKPDSTPNTLVGRQVASAIFAHVALSWRAGRWLTLIFLLIASPLWGDEPHESPQLFRVCADPNNLPFSNQNQEGFENKIAELLAKELHAALQYTWWPQRRGFLRNTLNAGVCDIVMGLPEGINAALTTRPYYRSTYVFVYPKNNGYRITAFDDPLLYKLKIGVHLIGDDYANSPPAHLLSAHGLVQNVIGYSVYGDYSKDNPLGKIIDAVATGDVDVAIVWGPIAGYFAKRQPVPLTLTPVPSSENSPSLPLTYNIALGVRRNDQELKAKLDEALQRKATDIHEILKNYGVPLIQD